MVPTRAVKAAPRQIDRAFHYSANWVILSANTRYLDGFPAAIKNRRTTMRVQPREFFLAYPDPERLSDAPLWTDDYSDLFSALK